MNTIMERSLTESKWIYVVETAITTLSMNSKATNTTFETQRVDDSKSEEVIIRVAMWTDYNSVMWKNRSYQSPEELYVPWNRNQMSWGVI